MIDAQLSPTIISITPAAAANAVSRTDNNIKTKAPEPEGNSSKGTTLSGFARQLNQSALRASSREARLGTKELATLARSVIDKLTDSNDRKNRALHDAEVPDTQDSSLLERAKQATRFTNGLGSNPFAGLSQDTLALIIYDESGDFTLNERKAAFKESYYQQEAWNVLMCQRYVDEYNETGKSTQTLFMILAQYNDLPPIQKALYPAFTPPQFGTGAFQ